MNFSRNLEPELSVPTRDATLALDERGRNDTPAKGSRPWPARGVGNVRITGPSRTTLISPKPRGPRSVATDCYVRPSLGNA